MTTALHEILAAALTASPTTKVCVAFSGGTDSTALLHALAQLPAARGRGLRALHVDHRLHPDSADWAAHCTRFCESLAVPLRVLRVAVDTTGGEGIEAAARRARYAAFADDLQDGEWLALAHQRDDQVETVLLKLLRGAGPEGLAGMRVQRPFGRGVLWRPLLETGRETINNHLNAHDICCLSDPANRDPRFARNRLRHEVLPAIVRHWANAESSILHSARLCRAASEYLAHATEGALAMMRHDDGALDADAWLTLPGALRAPVLDHWLRALHLSTPSDAQRSELERQAVGAAEDAVPRVAWDGAEVRIWDGRLHAMPPLSAPPPDWQSDWSGAPLELPESCGTLVAESTRDRAPGNGPIFDPSLTVRLRRGGERIKPEGDPHTRELRDLFQRARIPPWLRGRCPLVFIDDELIAVADLWTSERGQAIFDAHGVRLRWQRPAWTAR